MSEQTYQWTCLLCQCRWTEDEHPPYPFKDCACGGQAILCGSWRNTWGERWAVIDHLKRESNDDETSSYRG
jgi:hypothetical protein